jgi:hypothetical protein
VVVLQYWKTTIFWSAKKPLVHADKGMVHLVVVEPDLYLYTLQALLWAYSSSRDTKQIFILPPLLKSSHKFTFDGQMVLFYHRKHPNTVIDFTISDRFHTFRNIFFEKMWFCHLFSKYDILKRSLNSLNYYYLIFLSRISTLSFYMLFVTFLFLLME